MDVPGGGGRWYQGRAAWARLFVLLVLVGMVVVPLSRLDGGDRRLGLIREGDWAPYGDGVTPTTAPSAEVEVVLASSLRPFSACADVLGHVKAKATELAGPYGLPWGNYGGMDDVGFATGGAMLRSSGPTAVMEDNAQEVAADLSAGAGGGTAGVDYSATNVQEAGVDEPDLVKTDGRRVFVMNNSRLNVVELSGGQPELVGSLTLPDAWSGQLMLAGDRLLITSGAAGPPIAPQVVPDGTEPGAGTSGGAAPDDAVATDLASPLMGSSLTRLTLVDVADSKNPKVLATMTVDGNAVTSRMVGDVVRVVVQSGPTGMALGYAESFAEPVTPEQQALIEQRATARNREVIADSTLANWLPAYRLEDRRPGHEGTATGVVADCDQVYAPQEFSGLGTVSVLTFDLSEGLTPGAAATVLADAGTVYASRDHLYVATNQWFDPNLPVEQREVQPASFTTKIHRFDIAGDGPARHSASGEVRGHVLNQFSLSEHEGLLRVATTEGFPDAVDLSAGEETRSSESFVTVLRPDGGTLQPVGQVGNLGRGEQIYAVRFIGDLGYVVTFRQVDPLYVVDLGDPAHPVVRGELKIPGYSAYLHPVGDGLLLGVGQDATDEGRRLGLQLSLFDVNDPAKPIRLHSTRISGPEGFGSSEAEWDHHAFLWWAATGLTVVPVEDAMMGPGRYTGAVAFSVDRDRGIQQRARLSHQDEAGVPAATYPEDYEPWYDPGAHVRRSLVVGDRLLTVSDKGMLASDLDSLARRGWVAFPAPPNG